MPPTILLAGGETRPRALVLAQLEEEGCDVTAVETWDEAELLLRKRAVQPALVVFDLDAEEHPEAALTTLARLAGAARSLVLTSSSILSAQTVRSLGFDHVLVRPYSVGDVINAVSTLVRHRGPTTTGPTTSDQD